MAERFEQEPITAFRRDVVAEDEWRIRVEGVVDELLHESRIAIAWAVRSVLDCRNYRSTSYVGFDVVLQASEILGRG